MPAIGSDTVPFPNCPRNPRLPSAGAVVVDAFVQLPVTPLWKSSRTSSTSPPTAGAKSAAVTSTVTVMTLLNAMPSFAATWKVCVPAVPSSGKYVTVPATSSTETVAPVGSVMTSTVTESPSASVADRATVTETPAFVACVATPDKTGAEFDTNPSGYPMLAVAPLAMPSFPLAVASVRTAPSSVQYPARPVSSPSCCFW